MSDAVMPLAQVGCRLKDWPRPTKIIPSPGTAAIFVAIFFTLVAHEVVAVQKPLSQFSRSASMSLKE